MDKLSYEFMDSCALVKFYNGTSGYFSFGYYVTGGGLQIWIIYFQQRISINFEHIMLSWQYLDIKDIVTLSSSSLFIRILWINLYKSRFDVCIK